MGTPCFAVVGYNNIRIYDVEKLRAEALKNFDAKVVLITEKKMPHDDQFADLVIEASFDPQKLKASLQFICGQLNEAKLSPMGILPFSDRGVPMGALMAKAFNLPGATPEQAEAGLDKLIFRQLDSQSASHPNGYRTVTSELIGSLEELKFRVEALGGSAFIKPAKEGNSRGCQVIKNINECERVWESLTPYHNAGVLVETLIENAHEFSWDYVAGSQWLTKKYTTDGHFRAEYQQIVPAHLEARDEKLLNSAGEHMRQLVSPQNGAWHNEIFLLPDATAAVETNMRPAGMHIWDLAMLSFDNFNPWLLWLRWSSEGRSISSSPKLSYYSGIRMLRARTTGRLVALPDIQALADSAGIELHQANFSVKLGDTLSQDVRTNADFIGHIIVRDQDYQQLLAALTHLASAIELAIEIH